MEAINDNIEFIVTLRCKHCGEITSLEIPLVYENAQKAIQDFIGIHKHPDPWTI